MDDGSFKKFTTADGLYSNRVFAMTTGADGSRWIGSFGGVARVTSLD
jgi:ligand-binding sensor domain-containing protein